MHTKKHFLLTLLFISSISLFAHPVDSVGVENENGKKVILHKVEPQETYYSIARKYTVPVKSFIDFNANKSLKPGMIIRIPTEFAFNTTIQTSNTQNNFIDYKVEPREYLGIIAKKFNVSVEDIKTLNHLNSNNLSIGQTLKIPLQPNSDISQNAVEKKSIPLPSMPKEDPIMTSSFELIEYKVGPREYLNMIAKKFNTTPEAIKELNHLETTNLSIGQLIKIKSGKLSATNNNTSTQVATTSAPDKKPDALTANNTQGTVVDYKVSKKETLSSIAKKFNSTAEDIKALNNFQSNDLQTGQIIKVRYATAKTGLTPNVLMPKVPNTDDITSNDTTIINATDRLKRPAGVYGLHEVMEKGVGTWISDENIDSDKMLALHKTAPIGTIIKVTNPMTNKSTFAKVVGTFNENESTKDVIIVITKAAADVIGVLDKRFQTSIVYGVASE